MNKQTSAQSHTLVQASLFLVLALLLPFLTGQIPQIGSMLCPMHLPVLLCGYFCGWGYGSAVGFFTPVLRSMLFGTPLMYPIAVCMSLELATYGLVAGMLYQASPKTLRSVYFSLLTAMITGRMVWGLARFLCVGLDVTKFGLPAFWAGAFATAIPGILVQLVLIPFLVTTLSRYSPYHVGCAQTSL